MKRRLWPELKLVLRRAWRLLAFQPIVPRPPKLRPLTVALVLALLAVAVAVHDLVFAGANAEFYEYGISWLFAAWAGAASAIVVLRGGSRLRLGRALIDLACIASMLLAIRAAARLAFIPTGLFEYRASERVETAWSLLSMFLAAAAIIYTLRAGRSLWKGEARFAGLRLVATVALPMFAFPYLPVFDGDDAAFQRFDGFELARNGLDWLYPKTNDGKAASGDDDAYPVSPMEDTLYRQASLLTGTLGALQPSAGTKPQMFFLAAAPSGIQDVFASEVRKAKDIFDENFGTRGHSAFLISSTATLDSIPLANTKNLQVALSEIGKLMNAERDVLVLYITRHGAEGVVQVWLDGHNLNQITPDFLANALDSAGIKNRVLIISACHSGSFIPRLAGPNTLIMAAARADRTSFGCGNGREWTYFGNALFNHAFRHQSDFVKAFDEAKGLIEKWEFWRVLLMQHRSEPQISVGSNIVKVLSKFQNQTADQRAEAAFGDLRPSSPP